MSATNPPRPFDYHASIDELRDLVHRARSLPEVDERHDSPAFRAWKHEVRDLLQRVQRIRYSMNTGFSERQFRAMRTNAPAGEDLAAFNRDLTDTVYELDLVIANYEKYGDPKASLKPIPPPPSPFDGAIKATLANIEATATDPVSITNHGTLNELVTNSLDAKPAQKGLELPDHGITVFWAARNMTFGAWATLIGALGLAYTAGVSSGAWPIVQVLLKRWLNIP